MASQARTKAQLKIQASQARTKAHLKTQARTKAKLDKHALAVSLSFESVVGGNDYGSDEREGRVSESGSDESSNE